MKKLILTTAFALIAGVPALAADLGLPVKAPPAAVVAASWTGLYIGAHGGFGGDRFLYPFDAPGVATGEASLTSSGGFGGGQIGFNYQFDSFLIGVEADIAVSGIEGRLAATAGTPLGNLAASIGTRLDWFGTVRGRLGFLVTPSLLVYGTGGWAYGETTSFLNANGGPLGVLNASFTNSKSGWTAGGGFEYAINNWISLKTEYLYLDLGEDNITTGNIPIANIRGASINEHTTVHTVKAGINFKLGSLWGN